MPELVFAMELRGTASPVEGKEDTFRAQTSGIGPGGEPVTFDSEVVITEDGFEESGSIDYAGRGTLRFETIGVGHAGPSPVLGWNHGTIMWKITGGDGEFSKATGLITSNFTSSDQGEVVDNQYVRVFTTQ